MPGFTIAPENPDMIASIEIGTNSIRMLVAERSKAGNSLKPVLRKRAITRLGKDFNKEAAGTIKQASIAASLRVLNNFLETARQYGVQSPITIATGVVRKAFNGNDFTDLILKKIGLQVKIISGMEEAALSCKGILSSIDNNKKDPLIAFDLGGGSTEFALINSSIKKFLSVDIGAVILTEEYLYSDPPNNSELARLTDYIEYQFEKDLSLLHGYAITNLSIAGTGGTVTALSDILNKDENLIQNKRKDCPFIRKKDVSLLFEKMKSMPATERVSIRGLQPERSDIIIAGTLLVIKIMDFFNKDKIIVSYSDLLEGLLIDPSEGEKNE